MINWTSIGKILLFCFCLICFWGLVEQARQINRMGYAIQELQTRDGVTKDEMDTILNRQENINNIFKEYLFKLLEESNQSGQGRRIEKEPKDTLLYKI